MKSRQKEHISSPAAKEINEISVLLAHALALEEEAAERYWELAEVMESHNNSEAAELFAKMAGIEQKHVDEIHKQIAERELTELPSAQYRWVGPDGPETTDFADLHYMMTPHQALSLALTNEKRARDYYRDIARESSDPEVIKLARDLAEEEREHVAWVELWLERFPQTEEGWDHDDDPPILQG